MKGKLSLILLSLAALACGGLFALRHVSRAAGRQASPYASSAIILETAQVKEIEGYRRWSRVNPAPVNMDDTASTLCAIPLQLGMGSKGPHRNKFITVYVNGAGRRSMTEELKPVFPEGSVIVKEKLSESGATQPELLTVMIKREKGFNPELGGWEFMVTDGAGRKVEARGRLSSCQSCHTTMSDTDFIYRSYLPASVRRALR